MKKKEHRYDYPSTGIDRLDRILHNIREVWYVISGTLIIAVEPEERAKAEKRRNRIIATLIAIVLLTILLIIGIPWIKYYNEIVKLQISKSDGLQFISTFWGAIIGALLAAALTIISTWLIINRSYRVDFHRDRIDHLPVLCLHEVHGAVYNEAGIKLPDGTLIWSGQEFQTFDYDEENLCKILEISNIGTGIALCITTNNGFDDDPPVYFTGIAPQNIVYLVYGASKVASSGTLRIWFKDIFENKYIQRFCFELNDEKNMFFIGGSVPELVERTKRLRYMQ